MRELIVDDKVINDESECFVIAEVGHNHQGSVETAKEIFKKAKEAGANAVKLQKRDNKILFTKEMYNSHYNSKNAYGDTYGKHRDALEFGMEEYIELQQYAKKLGLIFFATPFDLPSVDFLEKLNVPMYKIASGDLKSTPLLNHVAKTGKPVLVSTGGGEMDDVQRAYDLITAENPNIAILQCTAAYPCEPEEMNLKVITTFRENFPDKVIGLSDHQSGISMALVAFTLGARIVEKHFTINRAWKGTDHAFSLEPVGLTKLVRDLRRAKVAIGDGVKQSIDKEVKPLFKMGKKLVAATDLKKGKILTDTDITIKSPNDGLPPYEWDNIIGLTLKKDLKKDENINFADLN
jgi:N-acetylneuraminate synthase/sialic acid synthase